MSKLKWAVGTIDDGRSHSTKSACVDSGIAHAAAPQAKSSAPVVFIPTTSPVMSFSFYAISRAIMAVIPRPVLSDQIMDAVRKRIIAGEFDGGAPIRQDALAAGLGVSKIPLREAFAKLEQEGLIVARANRGYFVSPLSTDEALEVFDLRLKLEPSATAEASARLEIKDIETARKARTGFNEAIAAANPRAGAFDREFHVALARPCRRPLTVQIIERLHSVGERYFVKLSQPTDVNARSVAEHRLLFEAWAAGRAERAATLATEHILATRDALASRLRDGDAFRG